MPLRKESGAHRIAAPDRRRRTTTCRRAAARTSSAPARIGVIAIGGAEKFKGGSRIEFLCGGRALQRFRVWRGALSAMQKHLSVPPIDMAAAIERMQDDAKAAAANRPRIPGEARGARSAGAARDAARR